MFKGVDISYWQGLSKSVAIPNGIDWNQVKASGISFVIIKTSEGIGRIEPRAKDQSLGASKVGLQIGYYHFAHPGEDTAITEADLFYKCISQYPKAQIIPTLDIEINKAGLNPQQLTQWIVDFVTRLQGYNIPNVMLYSYGPFFNKFLLPNQTLALCPLWLADYQSQPVLPNGWSNYNIWQYSQAGSIPGIQGNVDLNQTNQLPLI